MLEIPLVVLVIQIRFHAALNNRGYSSNPLIPIARSGNSEQTRRLADPDSYLLSRGSSASNEMSDSEYDSSEEYSFRSHLSVQYPYQRRVDDLRYSTRPENDASLETAPIGRINSKNYVEIVPSSSSPSRRIYQNYRRPYSARGPTNLGQGQTRRYNRKKIDDSSLEVSSLEGSNPEYASREEAYSLLSPTEKSFKRRGQNRKYYRKGNSLSDEESPIDKLDADEDAVHNPNSQNKRRNYRKEFSNQFNLRVGGLKNPKLTNASSLIRRKSNGNSRSSLRDESLSDDHDETGQLTFLRLSSLEDLNLESPLLIDQNGLNNRISNSKNFLRRSLSPNNKLNLDEFIASDLSELLSETLEKLNLVLVSLRRIGPSSNKYSRRENRLSAEEDHLTNPSDLRLGSLDIPTNSELPIRRYSEPAYRRSKKNLRRKHGNNRAALKKQVDEDTAKTLLPYHEGNRKKLSNSKRNGNQNSNRKDDFSDEFSLDTLFDFRKEDDRLNLDDNLSSNLSVLRSTNQDNLSLKQSLLRSSDENESKPTTDILNLKNYWTDVLSLKNKKKGLRSQTQLRNDEKKDKTKDYTEILQLEHPWTDVLIPSKNKSSGLRSLTQLRNGEQEDKTKASSVTLHLQFLGNDVLNSGSNKSAKSKSNLRCPKQKDEAKDTTDTLHLEYPWNNSLTPDNNTSSKQSELTSKSLLRSSKKEDNVKDSTDILHLEFPLNDELSPDNNKSSKQSVLPGLGPKSMLRSPKQKDDKKDTTDVLHLEYPWNDQFSPDNNKSKQLRNHDQEDIVKDTTDVQHLEFPWNDEPSSNENETGKSKSHRRQTDNRQDKEPKDELEIPWNGKTTNLDDKKTGVRIPDPFYVHPYLRNRNIKKHPNYFIRSYDVFSEGVRLENSKNSPLKRSNSLSRQPNRRLLDSKNLRVLPIVRQGPEKVPVP